jgi:hypothetical protein
MKTTMKGMILASWMLTAGLGCAALPRPAPGTAAAGNDFGDPLASGPAIVHVTTGGEGTATLYLVDDSGANDARCPRAAAELAQPLAALTDESHVSDIAVPRGKRICAAFDSPAMSMSWLAESYAPETGDRAASAGRLAPVFTLARR